MTRRAAAGRMIRTGRPVRAAAAVLLAASLAGAPIDLDGAWASDTLAPVAAAPTARPTLGAAVGSVNRFTVSWPAASDAGGSGIARYQLRQRVDGGAWEPVPLASSSARSVTLDLRPPHHLEFAVRAVDRAGNAGAWAAGPAFRQRRLGETTSRLSRSPGWVLRSSSGYLGGGGYRSGTPGATATLTFTGSQVAWIAPRGTSRGRAEVAVDGVPVAVVDLHRASPQTRRVVFRRSWATSGPHILTIRVLGTAGHPYVDIDGFVVVDDVPPDPVLVGAGDVTLCGSESDERTARLLDGIAGTVFVAGDIAYPDGTAAQLRSCYGPSWGRWHLRTRPVPGNHDYVSAGAAPYYAFFGSRAGPPGKGWYAYDLGTWRIYGLNSNCTEVDCDVGSEQERWLRADLAANPRACVAAVWHHPLFSSGTHGGNPAVRPLWDALADAGAEVVLNGHDHDYERFAPQAGDGTADSTGMRQFVVGTGGAGLRPFDAPRPNSEVRNASTHGVLVLTLRPDRYDWSFVPVAGRSFRDTGSTPCH